jgi:hypothetical protein
MDMTIEKKKNSRRMYFRPRKTPSSQTGIHSLRRNTRKPLFHANSEMVAIGQIQEQNDRLKRNDTVITVTKIITAAG